ncbi:enoyl-CoA hydratase-related protein [Streptomyces litchfieldiae]|uniref:Enoyl-CoA hydratase-related protein n=1 Tax=Streptomyces litchfieldiae TaxID=3075543 RepID=A0ABU2MVU9_9ACTN|nr:enoyl-CoA hydratase-related protein [Streptomyces sp. DSM 44938]MDT0345761.1 enoyl-CoA hydratase-related protein [Streptomyces sp. DSM 44938]
MEPVEERPDAVLTQDLGEVRVLRTDQVAVIEINRPHRLNAFTRDTVDQLITAFREVRQRPETGAIVLTGAGRKAFCAGGDQKHRAEVGGYGAGLSGGPATEELFRVIRECPQPVIAAVNGHAMGGGHVMHLVCDLSVASADATFAQPGPRVGSFDAGYGSALLARVVGEKRARQMLLLGEHVDAATALGWGLVNAVVEPDRVLATALEWGRRCCAFSPTALAMLKHSLNADTEHIAGLGRVCYNALSLFGDTEEAREGYTAFTDKRQADFSPFRAGGPGGAP